MMRNISKLVAEAISRIKVLKSPRALRTIYQNAINHQNITEFEREMVVEALEQRMREVSPNDATRLFGPRDSAVRQFMENTYKSLTSEFDFAANRVKNGVKVGGHMINGEKFVDLYLSYKSDGGVNVGLSWVQEKADSDRFLSVKVRQVGGDNAGMLAEHCFKAGQEDAAIECYREELAKVVKVVP